MDETAWLTQKALADLFSVKVPTVNKHLKNIFEPGELIREATISKMEIACASAEWRNHHRPARQAGGETQHDRGILRQDPDRWTQRQEIQNDREVRRPRAQRGNR